MPITPRPIIHPPKFNPAVNGLVNPTFRSALNQSVTTLAQCFKITRSDGVIIGYTDHVTDVVIGGVTYVARPGITPTQESISADLAVDNLDVQAMFDNSLIKRNDVLAGKYDHARFLKFVFDYTNISNSQASNGILVRISGFLAEVKVRSDGIFNAQLLSLNDVVSQNPLEVCTPTCRANLGDIRCHKSLAGTDVFGDPITVTGSVTSVLDGVMTRSSVVFHNMSNGGSGGTNQFILSTAGSNGATSVASASSGNAYAEFVIPDNLSGAAGLTASTTVTSTSNIKCGIFWNHNFLYVIQDGIQTTKISSYTAGDKIRVSLEGTTWKMYQNDVFVFSPSFVSTVSYPLYFGTSLGTAGARVTNCVLASSSGGFMQFADSSRTEVQRTFPQDNANPGVIVTFNQFANGVITFTSGANNGLVLTVKDYDCTNKIFTLDRPSPFPIGVGDTYSCVKGCTKVRPVCVNIYSNGINMRAETDLPGPEKILSRP